jgi:hypothetical protein
VDGLREARSLIQVLGQTVSMSAEAEPDESARIHHAMPKASTIKELYGTALHCGLPTCSEPLYRENTATGERILNSRVAHIQARSEGGPRWDPVMSEQENRGSANLILLCERHAWEIDNTPEHYPADLLRAWKQQQLEAHARVQRTLHLSDDEVVEVSDASFSAEDLVERLTSVVPFSARSRSRAQALAHASNSCLARSRVRLRSAPADRRDAVLAWMVQQTANAVVTVPEGTVRVLVAPMGAGKSEEAERWWSAG